MQLIYRAYTFNYTPPPVQPYQRPQALNWRWQRPGENVQPTSHSIRIYHPPRALNWRFQV